jgi:hypothetical protein
LNFPSLIHCSLSICTQVLLLVSCLLFLPGVSGEEDTITDEERAWLEADDDTSQVSEGELRFLPGPADREMLHIQNRITILPESLTDGWVKLIQCHHNLAPVPDIQIVYQYRAIQALAIEYSHGVGTAWIEGQSVQMRDVIHNASICISAKVAIFRHRDDKTYSLDNGPYHLRFLDGYYPLHVTLEVDFPSTLLSVVGVTPAPQPGVKLTQVAGKVLLDAYFEGMLYTEIRFQPIVESGP